MEPSLNLYRTVLLSVNIGTIVLDDQMKIVVWNQWMENYSFIPESDAIGKTLGELFPDMQAGRLPNAIQSALVNRLPSLLSQTLNKSPLPLYLSQKDFEARQRMQQAIQVIPILPPDLPVHCLVQISDVSLAVNRESILRQQAVELRSKTYTDGLTGIPNRRRFNEHATEVLRLAKRTDSPVSLIMIDIDFFKQFNDHYGHLRGDQCLSDVANALACVPKRPLDMVARWGGEEFIAILPNTPQQGAEKIATDMIAAISDLHIEHASSQAADHVSISLGVTTCTSLKQGASLDEIVKTADHALYDSKKSGRNRFTSQILEPASPVTN